MENNKSPERLIIYLIAAIWVFLLFCCVMTALKPTPLGPVRVTVPVHLVMNILVVYATLSTATWRRRIFISGILAVTLVASLFLVVVFPPNLFRLTNAMLAKDVLMMLNILNWTSLFAIVLFVLGSFLQWQFGPLGVRAQKLSIKTLLFVMTAVALTVALETTLAAKLDRMDFLYFALIFLPKLFSGLGIAWIATHRRWRLALPAIMLISPSPFLVMMMLITGRISNPAQTLLQFCLPDLIGSGILIWFYIAISRRGWQLHVASNPNVGDRPETDLLQTQGPVGLFPEDANA